MSSHVAMGGPILTSGVRWLAGLGLLSILLIAVRFAFGLGAVTAMNDGYPWGLWIAYDVVVGTAVACGGYAMALLVYILNNGKYHPLVRPAILTSALGYTIAALSVVIDIGRPWNMWKVPLFVWDWNLHSVLLEVALCIMAYTMVLWVEISPAFLEPLRDSRFAILRKVATNVSAWIEKALIWIIALGILLPTMHQSSLGSLMMIAGPRLHPLWNTPALPLLFLLSCAAMGYAVVVFESALASITFRREPETNMLSGLGRVMVPLLGLFLFVRLYDFIVRDQLANLFRFDKFGMLALLELGLAVASMIMLSSWENRLKLAHLFRASLILILQGAVYRFNTYLVAFQPGPWSYFPSVSETMITVGFVAIEIAAYVTIVRVFQVFGGIHEPASKQRGAPGAERKLVPA